MGNIVIEVTVIRIGRLYQVAVPYHNAAAAAVAAAATAAVTAAVVVTGTWLSSPAYGALAAEFQY